MFNYEKLFKNLLAFPWRNALYLCAFSFVLASVISFLGTYILMPKFQNTPEALVSQGTNANLASLETQKSLDDKAVEMIIARNIFNREGTLGDIDASGKEGDEQQSNTIAKTDLPVRLLGIIYGGTPYNGLATIENTEKNKINSFIVGDMLQKDAEIIEIRHTKIIIARTGGRKEFLEMDKTELVRSQRQKKRASAIAKSDADAPIATGPVAKSYKEPGFEREGSKTVMSDSFKQKLLGPEFTKVLQDAKASPNMVDGQVKGFRLTRIREGSVYQKAGFQNDDVVMEINGVPLNNAASAIRLLQSLRNEKEVEVLVSRSGVNMPLIISVQ